MIELLRRGLAELHLDVARSEPLAEFARLLLEKNEVMNLTAITEPTAVAQLHLLDCAALTQFADLSGKRVVDVGTGAGFPGVPLRILRSDFDLTLLDSLWIFCARSALRCRSAAWTASMRGRRSLPASSARAMILLSPAPLRRCPCSASCACRWSRWAGSSSP